eukprot:446184-Pleurochrysis_carterae.AAC.1
MLLLTLLQCLLRTLPVAAEKEGLHRDFGGAGVAADRKSSVMLDPLGASKEPLWSVACQRRMSSGHATKEGTPVSRACFVSAASSFRHRNRFDSTSRTAKLTLSSVLFCRHFPFSRTP